MKSVRFRLAALSFVWLTLVAATPCMSSAQEAGRRGGFGPAGGMGFRGGDPILGLLQIDQVKTELEITADQTAAIEKLIERSRADNESRERPNFRELSDQERTDFVAKMIQQQADRIKQVKEQLEEVLLPEQNERLEQIWLQARGVQALDDEQIRQQLNITEQQITKLAETRQSLQVKMREKMQELFQSGDREAMREAFGEFRKQAETELLDVLTPDQRSQFEQLKGEPIEIPELAFGRGRGGAGGAPGQGGRRRSRGNPDNQ
jgi:Spy/CpxP family protein refolding chaperone